MPKPKERIHREWFRTVMDKRKSCPYCHVKLPSNESVWSWGEYIRAKWKTVRYFCISCFPDVRTDLEHHAGGCGCKFELVGYWGQQLPDWLSIEDRSCRIAPEATASDVI